MKHSKRIFSLLSLFLFSFTMLITAQIDISYFMRNTPTSHKLNPSSIPLCKDYLNLLPISGIGLDLSTEGFKPFDVLSDNSSTNFISRFDFEKLLSKASEMNSISTNLQTEIFGFGYCFKRNYISVGIDMNINTRFDVSKNFIDLFTSETNITDKEIKVFDDERLYFEQFITPSVAYAREIIKGLTVGVRFKMPMGINYINTDQTQLRFTYDKDILEVSSNFNVTTSNAFVDIDYNTIISDGSIQLPSLNSSGMLKNIMNNRGFALDIGGTYKLNNNMEVSASILDFAGSINWKSNIFMLTSKANKRKMDMSGVTVDANDPESVSKFTESVTDSIIKALDIQTNETDNFKTKLPTKIYLGYSWNFFQSKTFGHYLNVLYRGENGANYSSNRFSVFYDFNYKKNLFISVGNTFASSMLNPSAMVNAAFGPFNIFAGGMLFSSYKIAEANRVQLYGGISLTF